MKKFDLTRAAILVSLCFLLVMASAASSCTSAVPKPPAAKKQYLVLAAFPSASPFYPLCARIAELINTNVPEVEVSVRETTGSVENLKLVINRTADFGGAENKGWLDAYEGKPPFEQPNKNLRVLWIFMATHMHWVVGAESDIYSLHDLTGRKVHPSGKGGTGEIINKLIFGVLGIKPEYFESTVSEGVDAFKDRRIDAYCYNGTVPTAQVLDIQATRKIRLLSISDADLAKVKAAMPWLSTMVIPANTYKGQTEDVQVVGTLGGFFCRDDLDNGIAYKMTKALIEHMDELAKTHPLLEGFDPANAAKSSIPLHPGAAKYYQELGVRIPPELIGQ